MDRPISRGTACATTKWLAAIRSTKSPSLRIRLSRGRQRDLSKAKDDATARLDVTLAGAVHRDSKGGVGNSVEIAHLCPQSDGKDDFQSSPKVDAGAELSCAVAIRC